MTRTRPCTTSISTFAHHSVAQRCQECLAGDAAIHLGVQNMSKTGQQGGQMGDRVGVGKGRMGRWRAQRWGLAIRSWALTLGGKPAVDNWLVHG